MKIIDKPIDEIQEYENNPRKNDGFCKRFTRCRQSRKHKTD